MSGQRLLSSLGVSWLRGATEEAAGAARVIEERELAGESLARAIAALVDAPATLSAMDQAARRLGRKDAAARVADLLSEPGGARA